MKEILISLFSGIIGVLLTIGYQHFFSPEATVIVNIDGKVVEVTSAEYEELVSENETLKTQNDSLTAQNAKYFDDLTEANSKLEELQLQINDLPSINYSNLALSVDGEDIAINQNNSMVTIDSRDYVSKEIMEKLVPDNQNVTIKDNTIFVGKVIANKANLVDQWVVNKGSYVANGTKNVTDSYGNLRSNAVYFGYYGGTIIYNLNSQYAMLKCSISMSEKSGIDEKDIITIKADDTVVYSIEITKTMEPIINLEIPINNCALLTIDCNSSQGYDSCIISDAIVYN